MAGPATDWTAGALDGAPFAVLDGIDGVKRRPRAEDRSEVSGRKGGGVRTADSVSGALELCQEDSGTRDPQRFPRPGSERRARS